MRWRDPTTYLMDNWATRAESLPGYNPQLIQSDYAQRLMRQSMQGYIPEEIQSDYKSRFINDAMVPMWEWNAQHNPENLAADGRPLGPDKEELPYGAVEWTPQGNPSWRKEGEGMLTGIWNKYWSTLTAPYGSFPGEGNKYSPTAQSIDDIQRLLKAGVITKEEARKREAERAQMQGVIQYRIDDELSKVTGEKADLGTIIGRAPKAILVGWIDAIQLPAY